MTIEKIAEEPQRLTITMDQAELHRSVWPDILAEATIIKEGLEKDTITIPGEKLMLIMLPQSQKLICGAASKKALRAKKEKAAKLDKPPREIRGFLRFRDEIIATFLEVCPDNEFVPFQDLADRYVKRAEEKGELPCNKSNLRFAINELYENGIVDKRNGIVVKPNGKCFHVVEYKRNAKAQLCSFVSSVTEGEVCQASLVH